MAGMEIVNSVETTQKGGLSAAGRADECCHPIGGDVQAYGAQGLESAVEEIEIADTDFPRRGGRRVGSGGVHDVRAFPGRRDGAGEVKKRDARSLTSQNRGGTVAGIIG